MKGRARKLAAIALFCNAWLALACGSSGSGLFAGFGRSCVSAADCDRGQPICGAAGVCVECVSNANCQGDDVCDAVSGKCSKACATTADCAGSERLCAARGVCVECAASSDCEPGQTCVAGDCITHCASDADCGGGHPSCIVDTGECVECTSDAECSADKPGCVLSEHRCRDCSNDAQCNDGKRCDVSKGQCQ